VRALDEARREAVDARAHAARDFAAADLPPPVDEALLEGLDLWRAKIEGTARAGRWSSAEVGLERWVETCRGYVDTERAALAGLASLADRKAELAGRLSARRAQLAALRQRGAHVDPSVGDLDRAAEAALGRKPLALADATARVEAFEASVLAAAQRRP
jgi:hypothetical protein